MVSIVRLCDDQWWPRREQLQSYRHRFVSWDDQFLRTLELHIRLSRLSFFKRIIMKEEQEYVTCGWSNWRYIDFAREKYEKCLLTAVVTWVLSPSGPSLARPKSDNFGLKSSSKSTFDVLKSLYITCPENKQTNKQTCSQC